MRDRRSGSFRIYWKTILRIVLFSVFSIFLWFSVFWTHVSLPYKTNVDCLKTVQDRHSESIVTYEVLGNQRMAVDWYQSDPHSNQLVPIKHLHKQSERYQHREVLLV